MWVLTIIAAIIMILLFLLFFPIKIEVEFKNEFKVSLKYLFLKINPLEQKPEKTPKDEEIKSEQNEDEAEKSPLKDFIEKIKEVIKKEGTSAFLSTLFQIVGIVKNSSLKLLSHVKFRVFDLYFCVGGMEDAANAATDYGKASAIIYPCCGFLLQKFRCKKKYISLDLNYNETDNKAVFYMVFSVSPFFVIKEALSFMIKMIPFVEKHKG